MQQFLSIAWAWVSFKILLDDVKHPLIEAKANESIKNRQIAVFICATRSYARYSVNISSKS